MDTNSIVVLTGLIAFLIAWGAASDATTVPSGVVWRFSESWTTSAAGVVALGALQFLGASDDSIFVVFALVLVLTPLLYRGFASASRALFVTVAALMAWATLAILTQVAQFVWTVTAQELTVVPRLVLNAAVAGVLVAATLSIHRALSDAGSGANVDASGAWTLP